MEFLTQMAEAGGPALHEMSPAEARAMVGGLTEMMGPGPEVARSEDHTVMSADGAGFGVTVLAPEEPVRGVLVYYHGGGWVLGSAPDSDHLCRIMANRTGCAVVNVDYRLAPEHTYPAAVDDCYAALEWTASNVDAIAGGKVPIMVCGDSAGGNLAAAVALRSRDHDGPTIAWQGLVYPVTDADLDNTTYRDPENQLMLNRDGMVWFWDLYVPDIERRSEPYASPLRGDLSGLPPALVVTAEYDVLREEGEAYAAKLEEAGVDVQKSRHGGQMHGFFTLLMLPGSGPAMDEFVAAVDGVLS
jgi:acetyl esterase